MALDWLQSKDHVIASCDSCHQEKAFSSDMPLAKRQMKRAKWSLTEKPKADYKATCGACNTNLSKRIKDGTRQRPLAQEAR